MTEQDDLNDIQRRERREKREGGRRDGGREKLWKGKLFYDRKTNS